MPTYAQIDGDHLTQCLTLASAADVAAHEAAHPGCRLLPIATLGHPRSHWYDPIDDAVKPRLVMTLTIAGTIIEGLPSGTVLRVDGVEYPPIDDGVAEIEFAQPGLHRVMVKATGYRTELIDLESS